MARYLRYAIVLGVLFTIPATVMATRFGVSKELLIRYGENVLHGFDYNGDVVIYFAGQTADLNKHLAQLSREHHGDRTAVLHVGALLVPFPEKPNDKPTINVDWNTEIIVSGRPKPPREIKVHIWIGPNINLKDIQIPANFKAVSGREIETFLESREAKVSTQ